MKARTAWLLGLAAFLLAWGVPHFGKTSWSRIWEVLTRVPAGTALLQDAAESIRLSARGYHRVLRMARTLADLGGRPQIGRLHLAEALSYRALADDIRRAA